nr:hypothetical protein [Tanacetum cinerariifolium]
AYENSVIYKERKMKLHDSKIKNHIFNVDDQVNGHRVKHYFGGDIPSNVALIYPLMIEVSCVGYYCPGPQELHILSLRLVWGNPYP